MISKPRIAFINSLSHNKHRKATGCFIAEGEKVVPEIAQTYKCKILIATSQWFAENPQHGSAEEIIEVSMAEMERISQLTTPRAVLGVFYMRTEPELKVEDDDVVLVLDGIQDPGNMGTILRTADWFGVHKVVMSATCADPFSPKVVQATAGSLNRMKIYRTDLPGFISKNSCSVYGTLLTGANIYETEFNKPCMIILGNEGNGISPEVEALVSHRITIPSFPLGEPTVESLNVAVASAIVLHELRRK